MRQSGVRLIFNQKPFFSHHTPTIQVFGLMKENSLSLSLFSLNGLNLILEASRCLFSWLGTILESGRRHWSWCSWDVGVSSPWMENLVWQHMHSVTWFKTSHSSNQNYNRSRMLWMDSTGPDVCSWQFIREVDSALEWILGWGMFMANEPSPCKNCYPQEEGSHFEHDGRPTYHNPFTPL